MRIGIDARLNAYRRGGIPEYTRQLLAAMARLAPEDELVSLQHRDHQRPLVIARNVRRKTLLTPPHHRLEQYALPTELLPMRLDVLHCPDFVVPRFRPCPAVVTIHDLAFLRYPDILDEDAKAYYSQVRASVHHANAVIAVSSSTRNDIAELLALPVERVDLVYEAASSLYRPLELEPETTRVVNDKSLTVGAFILFVSTLEPRKNIPTLLKALRICRDRRPDLRYRLVLAGGRGWRDEPIFAAVRDLRLEDSLVFLGSVAPEDLLWLYNACAFYVNPSLYEGFGLPVLEALACAAPCLVADTSSLPEVAGDAAWLLPPLDVEAWAAAIERLWEDAALREDYARRGPAQAANFSWTRAARETLAIYRRLANSTSQDARRTSQDARRK